MMPIVRIVRWEALVDDPQKKWLRPVGGLGGPESQFGQLRYHGCLTLPGWGGVSGVPQSLPERPIETLPYVLPACFALLTYAPFDVIVINSPLRESGCGNPRTSARVAACASRHAYGN